MYWVGLTTFAQRFPPPDALVVDVEGWRAEDGARACRPQCPPFSFLSSFRRSATPDD
jgi:hypothetical protein